MSRSFRHTVLVAALATAFVTGPAMAGPTEDARAQNAVRVLNEIQAIPESGIPDKLLDEARAIVVIPDTIKAGLIIGGRRGHGLMSVKTPEGTWSSPAFVKITGGSIGFQAGVQSSDVVLVFRNERSLESIVNGRFTLGADAGVAAGPVGRNAAALTDGQLKAEIWSWSRARGLFAGVALDGAVLQIDDAANIAVYGSTTTPRAILENRPGRAPSNAVVDFRDRLEEASATARVARGGAGVPASRSAQPAPVVRNVPEATTAPMQSQQNQPATQGFHDVADQPATVEPLPEY